MKLLGLKKSLLLASLSLSWQSMLLPALADPVALPVAPQLPAARPVVSSAFWDQVQSKGMKAFDASQYGDAERFLTGAVLEARSFPAGDLRLAKSAGALGRLLAVRGRFSEAGPYLAEELRVKELALGNKDGKLIPDMASLVHFYLIADDTAKADPLTERILSYVEGKLSEASTQGHGKVKLQAGVPLQGWAGEAAPAMRDPLIEWAIACDDIGTLYSAKFSALNANNTAAATTDPATTEGGAQSCFLLADRLFKAALDVKSTVLGKQHLSLANSYDSLGALSMARHHEQEAESYFNDALEITEKIQPPEHPQVYSRIDKLGKCLILEGKLAEAEQLYTRAQTLWQKEPSNCGNEARAMYALGSLYAQEKKYAEAEPLLSRAMLAQEQFQGPDSIGLVPYIERYAYVLYYLGRRDEVAELHLRSKGIQTASSELTMSAGKVSP